MKTPLTIGTKVKSAIYDAEGVPVCLIDSMQEASRQQEQDMARRVVACVNACAQIPTEKLESMATDPIEGLFGRLAGKAIAERRELLDALELYEKAFGDLFAQCCSNPVFNSWGQQVSMGQLNDAHSNACTVLRKLKGEEL